MENTLYYGDNLDIMRRYVPDESVDLVYADPPFKSDQNYNVLFKERDGSRAASQIQAFEDTWTWDQEDEAVFADLVTAGGKVADVLQAFRQFIGPCDMLAYLVMMAPRLVECRRVLKPAGSMCLHCDQAASHYLKMLMDAVFGPANFRNEIIWKRTTAHGDARRAFGSVTDSIFLYSKAEGYTFNRQFVPHGDEYLKSKYHYLDAQGRRYRLDNLRSPHPRPNLTYDYKGFKPHPNGWAVSLERMKQMDLEGRLEFPKKPDGRIQARRFLDEVGGQPVSNLWNDISPINSQAAERLGYPTQKPEALLERIIRVTSNEADVVLDPFCGCGTAVVVAQKLKRHWIGIDITHLAITLMRQRLKDTFGIDPVTRAVKAEPTPAEAVHESADGEYAAPAERRTFRIVGEPVSVPDAQGLAAADPYQFQWWALGLVGARPAEGKKGADRGIDGKIVFQGDSAGKFETVILSVKAGHVTANHVRDLRGVVDREKAAIGVLISMEDFTGPMQTEAATAGFCESKTWGRRYPKIQLLTVADLLAGKQIDMPPIKQVGATFKKAPRASAPAAGTQAEFPVNVDGEE